MRVNRSWTALGLGLALVAPAPALAQQPNLHLTLDYRSEAAPTDCPNEDELRAALARQLGYDPFAPSEPSLIRRVQVEIARSSSATVARIVWLDPAGAVEGERSLASESPECAELASGVVFAIAVQLQLLAATLHERVPPPPPRPRKVEGPPAESSGRSALAGVGVFGQRGWQPGLSVGLRAFTSLRVGIWSMGVEAHGTLPTRERVAAGGGFSARELALTLAPCVGGSLLDICALGRLGLVSVRGQGVDDARAPTAPELGVGVRLQVVWPAFVHVASLAHVDLLAQLLPRDVRLNGEQVWSTAPVAVAVGLDVAALFK